MIIGANAAAVPTIFGCERKLVPSPDLIAELDVLQEMAATASSMNTMTCFIIVILSVCNCKYTVFVETIETNAVMFHMKQSKKGGMKGKPPFRLVADEIFFH